VIIYSRQWQKRMTVTSQIPQNAGVHRARHPPDAPGRRHRAPHRRLDRAAGRNLALNLDERFEDFHFLIRDRGSDVTASFDAVSQAGGATVVRTASRLRG
jgi:hypothetical protein